MFDAVKRSAAAVAASALLTADAAPWKRIAPEDAGFDAEKLAGNISTIISTLQSERPASVKGTFIRSCTISSTMGVGVPVTLQTAAE